MQNSVALMRDVLPTTLLLSCITNGAYFLFHHRFKLHSTKIHKNLNKYWLLKKKSEFEGGSMKRGRKQGREGEGEWRRGRTIKENMNRLSEVRVEGGGIGVFLV